MSNEYSLNYFWEATSQEWAVFLEERKTDALSLSRCCISSALVTISASCLTTIFISISSSVCCTFSQSLRCNLFLFVFLAHQAHSSKLTSNVVHLLSCQLMRFTNFTYLLSFKHPASFVGIFIFICCSTSLGRFCGPCSRPIFIGIWLFGLGLFKFLLRTSSAKSNFALLVHISGCSISSSSLDSESPLRLRKQFFMKLADRMSLRRSLTHSWLLRLIPFWFIPLHFHDHLQVIEFLCPSQIVNSVDKWLFTHGNDLFADIFYQIVFQLFKWIFFFSKIDITLII